MNEKIIQFGPNKSLVGILTEPNVNTKKLPGFIFVNSGLLHRIGPFRIYVSLSRKLAESGYHSFRIDLSGKGDSLTRKNSLSLAENIKLDIKDAMDYLESQEGINQFIVCGICTGADNAYESGFDDDRITGIIPVDGYAYPTLKFKLRRYAPKLLNKTSWVNLIKRAFRLDQYKKEELNQQNLKANYRMIFPPLHQFKLNIKKALDSGKQFLIIYTGGWREFYNYEEQLTDCLPEIKHHKNLQLAYNSDSDHTFILHKDQRWLIEKITTWANERFLNK